MFPCKWAYYLLLFGATLFVALVAALVGAGPWRDLFINLTAGFVTIIFGVFVIDELSRLRQRDRYARLHEQFLEDLSFLLGRIEGFWRIVMLSNHKKDLIAGESYFEDKYLIIFANTNALGPSSRGFSTLAEYGIDESEGWKAFCGKLHERHSAHLEAEVLADLLTIERCGLSRICQTIDCCSKSGESQAVGPGGALVFSWPWGHREFFDAVVRLNTYALRNSKPEKLNRHSERFIWKSSHL